MKFKNIVFRVDSGNGIGWGHMMRCFSLAEAFSSKNVKISFISRKLSGSLCKFIEENGYDVHYLPNKDLEWKNDAEKTIKIINNLDPVDWLVVDNYELNDTWETILKPYTKKIMVIDDMTKRKHNCDLILDQNFYENMKKCYDGLIPVNCKKLIGPKFALLRKDFLRIRKNLRKRDGKIKRILVSFGSSDPTNEITKVIEAINKLDNKQIKIDLVLGIPNKTSKNIDKFFSKKLNITCHYQSTKIAQLMEKADLSIGSGGSTTWERCCLGLPSIVSISADNQKKLTEAVAKNGCSINLGFVNKLSSRDYQKAITNIDSLTLIRMSQKCIKLVDGNGIYRVVDELLSI
jgi:UDP-2,4-diacetamido-2,4,6-trideoxy-beta-L-altropyranose hydrolase